MEGLWDITWSTEVIHGFIWSHCIPMEAALFLIREKLGILSNAEHLFLTQPFSMLEELGGCSEQSHYEEKMCYKRLIPGTDKPRKVFVTNLWYYICVIKDEVLTPV